MKILHFSMFFDFFDRGFWAAQAPFECHQPVRHALKSSIQILSAMKIERNISNRCSINSTKLSHIHTFFHRRILKNSLCTKGSIMITFISLAFGARQRISFFIGCNIWKFLIFSMEDTGSDGYRYPSTDTVSVKMTKIVSVFVSVSALKIFCIRIRIRPEIFLYPYPYPFFNFFVFVSVSVSVINSKFIWKFFGARFIK